MLYLLFQMFLYMLVTLLLGVFLGWLLWRKGYAHDVMRMMGITPDSAVAAGPDLDESATELRSENARLAGDLSNANAERNRLQNELDACLAKDRAQPVATKVKPAPVAAAPVSVGTKPEALSGPRSGGADKLQEIKGIGPKLEKMLHGMGFYHFDQIAAWGASELAWVDQNLEGFKGRASRDNWVAQAKAKV
jgi:predicted flap endonuclease-1-like 5' DNA nuclease